MWRFLVLPAALNAIYSGLPVAILGVDRYRSTLLAQSERLSAALGPEAASELVAGATEWTGILASCLLSSLLLIGVCVLTAVLLRAFSVFFLKGEATFGALLPGIANASSAYIAIGAVTASVALIAGGTNTDLSSLGDCNLAQVLTPRGSLQWVAGSLIDVKALTFLVVLCISLSERELAEGRRLSAFALVAWFIVRSTTSLVSLWT